MDVAPVSVPQRTDAATAAVPCRRLDAVTDAERALITSEPDVLHGQVRIRGTRIPVSLVLGCLAEGMREAEIIEQYSTLTVEAIRAAAAYGAELAREEVLPLSPS